VCVAIAAASSPGGGFNEFDSTNNDITVLLLHSGKQRNESCLLREGWHQSIFVSFANDTGLQKRVVAVRGRRHGVTREIFDIELLNHVSES